ncbi:hypothetical protein RRG08_045807 [Elysia crispata]|uniref:Uncharacterized protein n=1 Tax=Elysia crispata TaxID=231223 RepID=A0AAE0Z0C0_9GAST|nr:hypothetical protein RRG08_045807 [Elysia crispata]
MCRTSCLIVYDVHLLHVVASMSPIAGSTAASVHFVLVSRAYPLTLWPVGGDGGNSGSMSSPRSNYRSRPVGVQSRSGQRSAELILLICLILFGLFSQCALFFSSSFPRYRNALLGSQRNIIPLNQGG